MKLLPYIKYLIKNDQSIVLFLIGGYFVLTLLCFILLLLPFCNNGSISIIDHLFFSVSLVSTTGLAPLNFSEAYSFTGQIISLFFIQLGGIGYMALSSFIILKKLSRVPTFSAKLLRLEFNLPNKYPLLKFIYSVFIFTILIELIGTIFLYVGFKEEGIENPIWNAVFHSISAFCTAGFSLYSDSLSRFHNNLFITNTISILSLLGSIGFIVLLDIWLRILRQKKRMTLTSKIILVATLVCIILPSLIIFISDDVLFSKGVYGLKLSFFQVLSAHTTVGFNNYPLSSLNTPSIFILVLVMVIGASPAGTGGGIKTTSITALWAVLVAILKRRQKVSFLSKILPASKIYLAVAASVFYIVILVLGIWLVLIFDGNAYTLDKIMFECSSALSTVGLSTGITGNLSNASKLVVAFLMFVGRLGVLTFGFALIAKAPSLHLNLETEDIAI